jgi:hypothetical protein
MRIRERNNESYITHNENINYYINQTYLYVSYFSLA